jgi:DNA-binding NtrC family response regulator
MWVLVIGQPAGTGGTANVAPAGEGTSRTGVVASVAALPSSSRRLLAAAASRHQAAEGELAAARAEFAGVLSRARAEGAQINELARAFGLSKPTLYRLLQEHAANQPPNPRRA